MASTYTSTALSYREGSNSQRLRFPTAAGTLGQLAMRPLALLGKCKGCEGGGSYSMEIDMFYKSLSSAMHLGKLTVKHFPGHHCPKVTLPAGTE